MEQNRPTEALEYFDTLVRRYGHCSDPEIQNRVVRALSNKASLLMQLNEGMQASMAYSELLRRFRAGSYIYDGEIVASAMFNRAALLEQAGNHVEAIGQYKELVEHFSASTEVAVRELYLKALFNVGCALMATGKPDDALDTFQRLIERAETTGPDDPYLRAAALLNEGRLLADLGRLAEAHETLRIMLNRFGESSDAAVQVCLTKAKERLSLLGK